MDVVIVHVKRTTSDHGIKVFEVEKIGLIGELISR